MPPPPKLPPRRNDVTIDRPLRSDSVALRQAEEWVRRNIDKLDRAEMGWLYEQYKTVYARILTHMSEVYDSDGKPRLVMRAQLLEQIEREMLSLYSQIVAHEDQVFVDAYKRGLYGRAWALDMATRDDIVISMPQMLPNEAIRALLLGQYYGKPWHTDLGYNFEEYVARIKSSLTQSMIQGEGMAAAQRRLKNELGIVTDRRRGKVGSPERAAFRRNFYRTALITRTEIMRASNLGALAVYEENQDILRGWEWAATRDERTCKICGGNLDGNVYKFGDPQIPPPMGSHSGCRCTPLPVLIDTALQDRVAGIRVTYAQWRAQHPIADDGGLTKAA